MTVANLLGDLALDATVQEAADHLADVKAALGTPAADDVLALLRGIEANTGTEVTRTETLELTAEQVSLSTDSLESLLTTTNARLGTTGSAGTVAALLDAIRANQANQAVQATLTGAVPLPSGAATETTLGSILSAVGGALTTNVTDRAGRLLGHVTIDNASLAVTGPLTDAQLRAAALPVSAAALPLPAGAATETTLASLLGRHPAEVALVDALTNATLVSQIGMRGLLFNGATWDRLRSAESAQGTTGAGLLGSGGLLWNGTTWSRAGSGASLLDGVGAAGAAAVANWLFNGTNWDRIRAALGANTGTQAQAGDSLVVTGSVTATGDIISTDARAYRYVTVQVTGTFVGTYQLETSVDGSNWTPQQLISMPAAVLSSGSAPTVWAGPVAGRYFRVRCSAFTSGTITVTALFSASPAPPPATQNVVLNAGTAIAGAVRSVSALFTESITPLASSGTFTTPTRDTFGSSQGSAAGTAFSAELRGQAISDVSGTLHLEVSSDGVTWRRIRSLASTLQGSLQVAEIEHKPKARYARFAYVNDATAQAHFTLSTLQLS